MSRFINILSSLSKQPSYTLMRGVARFAALRSLVSKARSIAQTSRTQEFLEDCEKKISDSYFVDLDRADFVHHLNLEGIAFGLTLKPEVVDEIRAWTNQQVCYAYREPSYGFHLEDRAAAEIKLGRPILLAQYFNTTSYCPAIKRLASDPVLNWIAASYLGSLPKFVGADLWWTFPVKALEADRSKHAHVYHRDVDDFRFLKFFFYLTDVISDEGAHMCVVSSHLEPPKTRVGDPWNLRRYSDDEIATTYSPEHIKEICGEAGVGFAENTLCIHKGSTPRKEPRLLLQLQFALFDYDAMHDRRSISNLSRLI
jgi:hypothetical protein